MPQHIQHVNIYIHPTNVTERHRYVFSDFPSIRLPWRPSEPLKPSDSSEASSISSWRKKKKEKRRQVAENERRVERGVRWKLQQSQSSSPTVSHTVPDGCTDPLPGRMKKWIKKDRGSWRRLSWRASLMEWTCRSLPAVVLNLSCSLMKCKSCRSTCWTSWWQNENRTNLFSLSQNMWEFSVYDHRELLEFLNLVGLGLRENHGWASLCYIFKVTTWPSLQDQHQALEPI